MCFGRALGECFFCSQVPDDLPLPDTSGCMRPANTLALCNDAWWLSERIKVGRIHYADVTMDQGQKLGVLPLSLMVNEVPRDGFLPMANSNPVQRQLSSSLGTQEFREGAYRLLCGVALSKQEELPFPNADALQDVLPRRVIVADELRSRLLLATTGEDVTERGDGSECLMVETPDGEAMCVGEAAPWRVVMVVAQQLNKLFGNQLVDLSPLEKILDCEPAAIADMLDQMHVVRLASISRAAELIDLQDYSPA